MGRHEHLAGARSVVTAVTMMFALKPWGSVTPDSLRAAARRGGVLAGSELLQRHGRQCSHHGQLRCAQHGRWLSTNSQGHAAITWRTAAAGPMGRPAHVRSTTLLMRPVFLLMMCRRVFCGVARKQGGWPCAEHVPRQHIGPIHHSHMKAHVRCTAQVLLRPAHGQHVCITTPAPPTFLAVHVAPCARVRRVRGETMLPGHTGGSGSTCYMWRRARGART